MKYPSILAISLDLQNYLLRAHQCRCSVCSTIEVVIALSIALSMSCLSVQIEEDLRSVHLLQGMDGE